MKSFLKLLRGQQGMSLPLVIMMVTGAVSAVGYITMNLLPQLQSEKKRAESIINYRVFMASLNDYLVHGIREKWCLNADASGHTDLLLNPMCLNGSMEEVVTYKGNLERVLWTADNIGDVPPPGPIEPSAATKIIPLNRYRIQKNLTTTTINKAQVEAPDGKLSFKITEAALNDMSEQHPLYLMVQKIRNCIQEINIEVYQVKEINSQSQADERKIGIKIDTKNKSVPLSCLLVRTANSTTYYTFYPRRLHSFSLMKYRDLDTTNLFEFHGPVYVAGDIKLPPEDFEKAKSSVFYNTLTLGIFKDGMVNGVSRAGKIVTANGTPYTFEQRGDPYLSKNDNYPGFRGFLGGIHLDASEDKGFPNLFDHTATSSADVSTLAACIQEAKVMTTPSANASSQFAYGNLSMFTNTTSNADITEVTLAFTERNRYKKSIQAPGNSTSTNADNDLDIKLEVPAVAEGVRAIGTITFDSGAEPQQATIGSGSELNIMFNIEKYGMTVDTLQGLMDKFSALPPAVPFNDVQPNAGNFQTVIEMGHLLRFHPHWNAFLNASTALRNKCDDKQSEDCDVLGYDPSVACAPVPDCNHASEKNAFLIARQNLLNTITNFKNDLAGPTPPAPPTINLSMSDVAQVDGKEVLNQKRFVISFNNSWKTHWSSIKEIIGGTNRIKLKFSPYHYGAQNFHILFQVDNDSLGTNVRLIRQDNSQQANLLSGWHIPENNSSPHTYPINVTELNCPTGMGMAGWDLDMSDSTNFAWNYANTPAGVSVDTSDHANMEKIEFLPLSPFITPSGHGQNTTNSVVEDCIVYPDRHYVYGFYVCKNLTIKARSQPLYMIGTYIVENLIYEQPQVQPVHWHSIWDPKSQDLVMTDLKASLCSAPNILESTFANIIADPALENKINACSSWDLVANGPNNFTWTTVDPEIGIANPGDAMTSQKTNRIQKWVIKEESRVDLIK